jgi:hypothetical protein
MSTRKEVLAALRDCDTARIIFSLGEKKFPTLLAGKRERVEIMRLLCSRGQLGRTRYSLPSKFGIAAPRQVSVAEQPHPDTLAIGQIQGVDRCSSPSVGRSPSSRTAEFGCSVAGASSKLLKRKQVLEVADGRVDLTFGLDQRGGLTIHF